MHPTQSALLQAVLASPEDDLPRLVLADWLEEHKEPERAEFIRVQCELAKYPSDERSRHSPVCLGPRMPRCRWCDLRQRELALICENVSEVPGTIRPRYFDWIDGLNPGMVPVRGFELDVDAMPHEQCVRRGFVAEVRTDLRTWVGGECEECIRELTTRNAGWRDSCPRCHRTGTVPGIGPAVVRSHPVSTLKLSDVHPTPVSGDMWIWEEELFDHIPALAEEAGKLAWATSELAEQFMSELLIAWAKTEASRVETATEPRRQQV